MMGIIKEKVAGNCLDVDGEGKSQVYTWVHGRHCNDPGMRR